MNQVQIELTKTRESSASGRQVVIQIVVRRPAGLTLVRLLRPNGELDTLVCRAGSENFFVTILIQIDLSLTIHHRRRRRGRNDSKTHVSRVGPTLAASSE